MDLKNFLKAYRPVPADPISNSKNTVSAKCSGCKHLNINYAKCLKSGTCIYDLAEIAANLKSKA